MYNCRANISHTYGGFAFVFLRESEGIWSQNPYGHISAQKPQDPRCRPGWQLAAQTWPQNCPAMGRTGHGSRDAENQFRGLVGAAASRLLRLQMWTPIPSKVGVLPGVLTSCGENLTKTVGFYYVFSRHPNHAPWSKPVWHKKQAFRARRSTFFFASDFWEGADILNIDILRG